ncbi:hypothetical protein MTHERMOG20_22920 [Moorella thermoacetica]|uniref:hypothetical protein n=1 Tax=Neomoorella thermoacetica TaxID=1525 RepID=UPI00069EFB91|nr:hypothetical protein [Moorella thermoacetica]GLI17838.1 hypothetical protein MTHERMOG20_22920 [Moorella thermoacetica]
MSKGYYSPKTAAAIEAAESIREAAEEYILDASKMEIPAPRHWPSSREKRMFVLLKPSVRMALYYVSVK